MQQLFLQTLHDHVDVGLGHSVTIDAIEAGSVLVHVRVVHGDEAHCFDTLDTLGPSASPLFCNRLQFDDFRIQN